MLHCYNGPFFTLSERRETTHPGMGTPVVSSPARLPDQTVLGIINQGEEEVKTQKSNYLEAIQTPATSSQKINRYGDPVVKAHYSTHNGIPTVIFKASDYYGVMADECKFTLVGKFLKTQPQIEKIRSKFTEKISIKGNVKIGVYDIRTVFLDFTIKDDFKSV